ncbi:hypothetical protein AOXY_G10056, partial [Acipenser oxyrinchus oxyrinchus]
MNRLMWCLSLVLIYFILGLKFCGGWVQWVLTVLRSFLFSSVTSGNDSKVSKVVESWERDPASRIYSCGDEDALVTVQTSTHCFQVDLGKLSECSEYFRALSHSRMKETTENLIHLDHIPSRAFHNLLEFTFWQHWEVPEEELREHIQRRRHFSTAVCEGAIFAVGGWYLDNLLAPDSSTALYTAVERYDPWTDTWAFVSSLPLTDFLFTVSLSH